METFLIGGAEVVRVTGMIVQATNLFIDEPKGLTNKVLVGEIWIECINQGAKMSLLDGRKIYESAWEDWIEESESIPLGLWWSVIGIT